MSGNIPTFPTIDLGNGISVTPLENDGDHVTIRVDGLPCGSNFAILPTSSSYGGFVVAVAPVSESLNALYKLQTAPCLTNSQIGSGAAP